MRIADLTTLEGFTAFAARVDEKVTAPTQAEFEGMTPVAVAANTARRRGYLANPPIVVSPFVRKLLLRLNNLMEANAFRAPGAKEHLGVQGGPGIGKSTATQHVAKVIWNREREKHGDVVKVGQVRAQRVPVTYSTAPAVKTYRSLISVVLRFFDARATGNAEAMTEQLLHLLTLAETDVVIIDDAHALRGSNRESLLMADSLKALINRIPCTVLFVGTGLENSVLFGKTTGGIDDPAAQLRHRVDHMEHPSYPRPSAEDPGLLVNLLGALEEPISQALRHHPPGSFSSPTMSRWMYDQTEGVTARVGKWLSSAAMAAVSNEERVTKKLLTATPIPGLNSR